MLLGRGGGVNSVGRALHYPYPRPFCTLPSFARIKGSTRKKIGDCEQSS